MATKKYDEFPMAVKMLTAGAAACIADLATYPLDTTKVRLQVQGEGIVKGSAPAAPHYRGVFHTIVTIAKEEGPTKLYRGLSAGLQRQMCFASIRIGLYDSVKGFYSAFTGSDKNPSVAVDVLTRILAGATTGAMAVAVAQPTDVVKVRFQAQKAQRYKSATEAYGTIFKEEGVRGLWKGAYPNIARNCIVNVSEIVCYDLIKDLILRHKMLPDNIVCHFISAIMAGLCTTVVSSPVDVIKTRYMNSPPGQYKSAIHCALQTVKKEGFTALYKGVTPSFSRLFTWNIVMWISYEQLKLLCTKIGNKSWD